jgi:hypothetical protein
VQTQNAHRMCDRRTPVVVDNNDDCILQIKSKITSSSNKQIEKILPWHNADHSSIEPRTC